MQQEEITAYIVRELGKRRNPKDIVLTLCENTQMPWAEAEKLVREVQSTHGRKIAARQSPVLIIFSVGLLILGIGMIFVTSTTLTEGFMQRTSLRYLIVGAGFILGGLIGLWNTISAFLKIK